jgi:formylglycine-generating enzyme required for sulfatase activity
MRLFICFAAEDQRFAQWLARYLRMHGAEVCLTRWHSGHPDKIWEQTLADDIISCSQFVLILSPAALNSWGVRDQTLLADREGKQIVVVLYRPCVIPERLVLHPLIDLSQKGRRWQHELSRLVVTVVDNPITPHRWRLRLFEVQGVLGRWGMVVFFAICLLLFGSGVIFRQTYSSPASAIVPVTPVVQVAFAPAPTPTTDKRLPNPEPTPVDTMIRLRDGKVMVLVPEGTFLMGSTPDDPDAANDEKPQRVIYVDAFWIDKTEVSNSQYQLCRVQGVCSPSTENRTMFRGEQMPVVGVNWEQAAVYCQWVGGRLPTEAEWEKAARGVDDRIFPWGSQFDGSRLNYCDRNCIADWRDFEGDDGYRYTAPVASFVSGASPYGVQNMSGNVWEWTADWYDPLTYQSGISDNPSGPGEGQQRVIRGGSWLYLGRNVRVTRRQKELPTYGYDNIGFRCVVPLDGLSG